MTAPAVGFPARKVARLLGLLRGHVVPLVVAIGHRAGDAHIEPRSPLPFADAVVER